MGEFESQVTNIQVTIVTKPRTFISWHNTEEGRDVIESYERVVNGGSITYINTANKYDFSMIGEPFFEILEGMYHKNK